MGFGLFPLRSFAGQALLFLALAAPALAAEGDKLQWSAGLRGRSTDDSLSTAKVASFRAWFLGEKKISDTLRGNALVLLKLESGSSQSLFTNEFEPRSGVILAHGSLDWAPADIFLLRAGALQQDFDSPLFVTESTFPAAQEVLKFGDPKATRLAIEAQQAMPTSTTLSKRAVGKEPTPTLYTGTLRGAYSWAPGSEFGVRGTYFQFNNLTRGVAQDSRFYGSTITGIATASQFVFKYRGLELGGQLKQAFGNGFSLQVGGSYLNNNEAPSGFNKGAYGFAELVHETKTLRLAPRVEYYRNESDSAPAFYTAKEFGHNNRRGFGGAFELGFPGKFTLVARYARSRLIEPRAFQRDNFTFIELTLETAYAGF